MDVGWFSDLTVFRAHLLTSTGEIKTLGNAWLEDFSFPLSGSG